MSGRRYVEPARSYRSCAVLFTLLLAGFLLDVLALSGGGVHVLAWVLATVIVVGFDLLITYAVRELRTIVVTDDELHVGENVLIRKDIRGVRTDGVEGLPILGRRVGEGLPRGTRPLVLELTDGHSVAIASRDPRRLAQMLGAQSVRPQVRAADPGDLAELPEIDTRAESLFRVAGMYLPHLPLPVDALHESTAVFVAGRPPVAFVQIDELDGTAHVQELAVLPAYMRQGIGSTLLEVACAWAREHGYAAITLTTYAEVAWNGPFYARRGFVELTDLTPELHEVRDWERDVGLDAVARRIAMRREL